MSELVAPLRRALERTGYLTGAAPAAATVRLAGNGGGLVGHERRISATTTGGVDRLRPTWYVTTMGEPPGTVNRLSQMDRASRPMSASPLIFLDSLGPPTVSSHISRK